jgi:L-asparaginase
MAGNGSSGVVPTLTGDELVSAVPQIAEAADVTASSFRQVPGARLRIEDLTDLSAEIALLVEEGADGIV